MSVLKDNADTPHRKSAPWPALSVMTDQSDAVVVVSAAAMAAMFDFLGEFNC